MHCANTYIYEALDLGAPSLEPADSGALECSDLQNDLNDNEYLDLSVKMRNRMAIFFSNQNS